MWVEKRANNRLRVCWKRTSPRDCAQLNILKSWVTAMFSPNVLFGDIVHDGIKEEYSYQEFYKESE